MSPHPFSILKEEYHLLETIGKGGFGKVKLAVHHITNEKVAIKIMEKQKLGRDLPRVERELAALKLFDHPRICKLLHAMETETHIFFVLEYCPGGELFDYIVNRTRVEECKARRLFRQLIAAIAYIHSKGFAHRDLKPENLLLDDKQKLKLIDFGLCAKPEGGMACELKTCCGSPAYAAPELILGRAYLGSEADVWSMGVLLYALLCGHLPFDDQYMSQLYQKITRGQYKTPTWLSPESKTLIARMLQVDPTKRITVQELCSHPWVTKGIGRPVSWKPFTHRDRLDEDVLNTIARQRGQTALKVADGVKQWLFNKDTALYLLYLQRKRKGLPLVSMAPLHNLMSISPGIHVSLEGGLDNSDLLMLGHNSPCNTPKTPARKLDSTPLNSRDCEKLRNDNDTPSQKENGEVMFVHPRLPSPRKHKRIRSPGIITTTPTTSSGDARMTSAGSVDAGLQALTPVRPMWSSQEGGSSTSSSGTPLSARRVLGSLERGLNRVRNILTPRGKRLATGDNQPAVLSNKGLCNVSTTASDNPEYVLTELRRTLLSKGIDCQQHGFLLKGKIRDDAGNLKLSFELEVCWVGPTKVIGIRRKRLRGDVWAYKRVCEEVLGMAALQTPSLYSSQEVYTPPIMT